MMQENKNEIENIMQPTILQDNADNLEQQFSQLLNVIEQNRMSASAAVNQKQLQTAWTVGGYVSKKIKTQQWGSKVVTQFAEYIRIKAPHLKGFSRRNIYNMVMFFDEYSSIEFNNTLNNYLPQQIVQSETAQMETLPDFLKLTSFTNHIQILCSCQHFEQRLFYMLYAKKENLNTKELQRCINNDTFSTLLSDKKISPKNSKRFIRSRR